MERAVFQVVLSGWGNLPSFGFNDIAVPKLIGMMASDYIFWKSSRMILGEGFWGGKIVLPAVPSNGHGQSGHPAGQQG
jgi:hypothetical protein